MANIDVRESSLEKKIQVRLFIFVTDYKNNISIEKK